MELTCSNKQVYQLELQVHRITSLNFKYKPPSFVFMEIGTNIRALATPFVVQHVATTKPISPLKGGTCLEIIPLPIHIFTIHVQVITNTIKPMESNNKSIKEHVDPIDPSYNIIFDSGTIPFKFLYATIL